jgi:hypothetical protein
LSHPITHPIVEGLDFILMHFQEPLWPRTISTHKTLGKQVLVFNKEEAVRRFKEASCIDCRINAYPNYTGFHQINRQAPNFILIDKDIAGFKSVKHFSLAVKKTNQNINKLLHSKPTILWTGNGIHFYQPMDSLILEQESLFSSFDQPSQQFLKYASGRLSDYRCDCRNTPAFRSCLVRIPSSLNSKCIKKNGEIIDTSAEVKVLQSWNSIRPKINPLLHDFYIYLVNRKIKEIDRYRSLSISCRQPQNHYGNHNKIMWIESLLKTPLHDYRKFVIWRILAPYLVNVRKIPCHESFNIIADWLDKCNTLEQLSFNAKLKIKEGLRGASKGYLPISFEKLRSENSDLYELVKQSNLKY